MYKRIVEQRLCNHFCSGKAVGIKYSNACLKTCLSSMKCACAILSSVASPALNTFPHYLIKGTIYEKKVVEHKMCVWIFSTTFV